jgi:hypothetical protein
LGGVKWLVREINSMAKVNKAKLTQAAFSKVEVENYKKITQLLTMDLITLIEN